MIAIVSLAIVVATVSWRPHGIGPLLGALVAAIALLVAGSVTTSDVAAAVTDQWRAGITLGCVMLMTSAADQLHLFTRLAARIEPRTRGPVLRAFRLTYILSALVAALLSNDAAVLVMTPTVIALLRTVYPRRHPKFVLPFAFAIFAAAGVAPLTTSNPMNLIFADHLGIGFNQYASVMIPVAITGWVSTYAALRWIFRDALSDQDPALGAWPNAVAPMTTSSWVVTITMTTVLISYPILSSQGIVLWPAAALGALVCVAASRLHGTTWRGIANGISWSVFPFLIAVFLLAIGLTNIGVVAALRRCFDATNHSLPVVAGVAAAGSALINNHPMSVLQLFALSSHVEANHAAAFASLIGGNIGPRLLPGGSLAALLWFSSLKQHNVAISLRAFISIGARLAVVALAVCVATLWLVLRISE
jgi:arsenical pump membrane protein